MNDYILIDLFSGTGGFAKGLSDAGFNFIHHYFSEIENHAIANYRYNFKNSIYAGDIKLIRGSEIRKKHPNAKFIITFGFPCQDLSVAGKGAGFHGERSVLFFEAIRLIQEIKPEIFIFENVKGLLSHNDGKTFEIVLRTIADIGLYFGQWQLVNTRWILPQNRERIFFIGTLRTRSFPKVFPITQSDFGTNERQGKTGSIRTLTAGGHSGGMHSSMTLIKEINPNVSYAISSTYNKGKYGNIRRLTEIECERLQGFPDSWTKYGIYTKKGIEIVKELPATARYKLLGNAVTAKMVELIGRKILNE